MGEVVAQMRVELGAEREVEHDGELILEVWRTRAGAWSWCVARERDGRRVELALGEGHPTQGEAWQTARIAAGAHRGG